MNLLLSRGRSGALNIDHSGYETVNPCGYWCLTGEQIQGADDVTHRHLLATWKARIGSVLSLDLSLGTKIQQLEYKVLILPH